MTVGRRRPHRRPVAAEAYQDREIDCRIYTYKDGMLSRLGHDLALRVTRGKLRLDRQAGEVSATFDPSSLEVLGAVRDGQVDASVLSALDRKLIERATRKDVLEVRRFPEVSFRSVRVEGRGEGRFWIEGELALHGRTHPLRLDAEGKAGRLEAEAMIHQPDFGITPYRAALGGLRVRPEVRVVVTVPVADRS